DAVLGDARQRIGAAGDVELAAGGCRGGGAARGRHRRELLPLVGRRVVLPRVVDGIPGRGSGGGQGEAAEGVDLVVQRRERDVVRRELHRLLFAPLIGGRVVFEDERLGLPARRQAGEHVKLAVRGRAKDFLGRLREGCGGIPRIGRRRGCGPL